MPSKDVWDMVIMHVYDGHAVQFVLDDTEGNAKANQFQ